MLALTWIPEVLAALPAVLVTIVVAALWLALWLPKRRLHKAIAASMVILSVGYTYHRFSVALEERALQRQVARDKANQILHEARARFEARCATAGEKVSHRIDNVAGVVWLKWRTPDDHSDYQYDLNDPFGRDCANEDCILRLLRITKNSQLNPDAAKDHTGRYDFVESVDPSDGATYRYVGSLKPRATWTEAKIREHERSTNQPIDPSVYTLAVDKTPIERFTARYGISWTDISSRDDRDYWIAGGVLTIVDRQANQVIAERVGYMMDEGQGATGGGRQPWVHAVRWACPSFPVRRDFGRPGRTYKESTNFIFDVLRSSKG